MESDIVEVETQFQLKFPPDYVEFMLEANGGEGTVGERNYLRLWKIEELIQDNEENAAHDFASGLILIGSDGGGTAYGYDFRNEIPKLVEVDFIGLDLDSPFYSTYKFSEFIEYLYNY